MTAKLNPAGVYLTREGKVYQDSDCLFEIQPLTDSKGYKYISGKYLNRKSKNAEIEYGFYLHRMIVMTFGDKNGHSYTDGCVIDHINMDHGDDRVENLEIVNNYINLVRAVRAYPDDLGCRSRYEDAMKKLHDEAPETYDVIKESIIADVYKYPISWPGHFDGGFFIKNRGDNEER